MRSIPFRDVQGAVFVEVLIAYLPVVFVFLGTWQLVELWAAHLLLERAASAAARAAAVVLPDDPARYAGERDKLLDVELAAASVLAVSPHFSSDFSVETDLSATETNRSAPITVTVRARFHCFAAWASIVCGGDSIELSAKGRTAYHGASYLYL